MKVLNSYIKGDVLMYESFDFGEVYYLPGIIITEFKEGAILTYEKATKFITNAQKFYENESEIIYISNRINSYSVHPTDWLKIQGKFSKLRAIAMVTYKPSKLKALMIERMFCPYPLKTFNSLNDAYVWATKSRGYNSKFSIKAV